MLNNSPSKDAKPSCGPPSASSPRSISPAMRHKQALDELAKTLGISQAHYRGLLAELDEE